MTIEKVLFMPNLPTQLLSPQQVCQQYGNNMNLHLDSTKAILSINGYKILMPYDLSSNLPITCIESNINNYIKAYSAEINKLDKKFDNLSR